LSITAAQLVAEVTSSGVDTTAAQLAALGTAADEAEAALATVGGAAQEAGAGLSTAGGEATASGAGFDALAAAADSASGSLSASDGALAGTATAATDASAALTETAVAEQAAGDEAESAAAKFSVLGEMSSSTESSFKSFIGGIPLLAGAAVVGLTALSVHMAGDFQESMTQLVTGAGESEKNLGMVSQAILNMAVQTGTSTKDLSDGMYMIESAGQHGAEGLKTLEISAEAAKVGNASLADVANGVTTAMIDYAKENLTASEAANTLIATVAAGKTHMQDLAQSMSTILPTASAVQVHFQDVMAAMATMTGEGVPAAIAATYLRQTLMSLENPSKKGATALKEIGLSSSSVATEMKKSLPDALKMITDALKKKFPEGSQAYNAALASIAGGTKQMQGMLDLTGSHMKTFGKDLHDISESVKKGGNSVTGWSKVQGDFNFKMAQAGEILQTGMIRVGTALLPIVGQLVTGFMQFTGTLAGWIKYLQGGSVGATIIKGVLIALAGAALGFVASAIPALVTGFIAWATAAGAAAVATLVAAAPFIAVGAAIALLVAGIVLAIQHWGAISKWLQTAWKNVIGWLGGALNSIGTFFKNIWNGLLTFFKQVWNAIITVAKVVGEILLAVLIGPIGLAVLYIITHWTQVKKFLGQLWKDIVSVAETAWKDFATAINTAVDFIENLVRAFWNMEVRGWTNIWNEVKRLVQNLWNDVTGIFKNAWNGISGAIHSLWNNITSFIASWPGQALQWGRDLIQNLINGITGMIGNVKNAIGNVANTIKNFIHFSKPDKGPLVDIERWMPDMGDLLAKGIKAQANKLSAAATVMITPVAKALGGQALAGGAGAGNALPPPGLLARPSSAPTVNVQPAPIYLDGRLLTNGLMPYMANAVRYGTGAKI
jgi:TP901 family phage tail tape measure protein